ncbi:hypothetical protein [Paenibacillus terrigena]|nr:hypothetical protein [Paenibacillus terrigena]
MRERLVASSADEGIQAYRRAIEFYTDKLEQRWDLAERAGKLFT